MVFQKLSLLGLIVLLAAMTGCGPAEAPLLPVAGKVRLGEDLLPRGVVILVPDTDKGNDTPHEPRGPIDAEGNFVMATGLRPGAPPGWYKIAVRSTAPNDPKKRYKPGESLIPTKYNNPATSGLSFEVVKDAPADQYDIKLQPD